MMTAVTTHFAIIGFLARIRPNFNQLIQLWIFYFLIWKNGGAVLFLCTQQHCTSDYNWYKKYLIIEEKSSYLKRLNKKTKLKQENDLMPENN